MAKYFFWCSSDVTKYSKSNLIILPIIIRNKGTRILDSSKICNHNKDGKSIQRVIF